MRMPTIRRIRRSLEAPKLVAREINKEAYSLNQGEWYESGINFFDQDWDNLLILDACRFDTYNELVDLPGKLTKRYSKASSTREWLESNCDGRVFNDTVYVTANPQLHHNKDGNEIEFHDVWNVWLQDGWDDDVHTVLPETMAEKGLEAVDEYPNKRIVIHLLQPHYPFIGDYGQEYFSNNCLRNFYVEVFERKRNISLSDVRKAYRENLTCMLPTLERLLTELPGKTVVTSDHGETFGERARPIPIREFGHPRGVYMEELVAIPWQEHTNGSRRKIVCEKSRSSAEKSSEDIVKKRLSHLGYKS